MAMASRGLERQREVAAERRNQKEAIEVAPAVLEDFAPVEERQTRVPNAPRDVAAAIPNPPREAAVTRAPGSYKLEDGAATRARYQGMEASHNQEKQYEGVRTTVPPVTISQREVYHQPEVSGRGQGIGGRLTGIITPPRPAQYSSYPEGQPDVIRVKQNVSELSMQTEALLKAKADGVYQTSGGQVVQLSEQEFFARKQALEDALVLAEGHAKLNSIGYRDEREKFQLIEQIGRSQQMLASGELRLEADAERNRHFGVDNKQREQSNQFRLMQQGMYTAETGVRTAERIYETLRNFGK